MNSPLTKGYTYLAITSNVDGHQGWIIQQTGQRSWVATQFTECGTEATESSVIIGNSIKCWEELFSVTQSDKIVWRKVNSKSEMREKMYYILKYGNFKEEK